MSELREELLAGGINKKRIIALLLVTIILISLFTFSVVVVSLLFGTQRIEPNKEKAITPPEDVILVAPPLPLDFLEQLLKYFQNDPEALQQLTEFLNEMFDGDIDNFDLSDYSQALLLMGALAGGAAAEQEVFRFYNATDPYYTDINSNKLSGVLWKMECFNEFTGDEWQSTANKGFNDFYPYDDYRSKYYYLDLFRMKMAMSPTPGIANSMVIPTLFPTPFIMEDSLSAPNLIPESTVLYKDDFNCSIVDLEFTSDESVNMTYEQFGLDLPSNNDINNSAIHSSYTPDVIKDLYLQLPPSINEYLNSHPLFKSHYDALNTIIDENDNAFVVANKIRNYLQANFAVGYDALMNDPQEDEEDIVDWFLEHGEGLWAEWASTFCAFTRAFNVPSRFVDGFKTDFLGEVDEIYDANEGRNSVLIKYKHLYNWAEVFVPTDVSGNGQWVQMDVIFDNFGGGPIEPPISLFNIDVISNFTAGYRPQVAELTATLSSPTGGSVENKNINFYDHTSEISLGSALTDQYGNASIIVDIDNSQVVGPHFISASYQLSTNYTYYVVYGDIDVTLTSVNPTMINRSISNTTRIQGFVNDPIANQRVKNATVEFVLLEKISQNIMPWPFDITYTDTDDNGDFDEYVNVNSWIPKGFYEIRVDFNGSWSGWPVALGIMNDSSNKIDFNITEESTFNVLFYINNFEADYYENPRVSRYSTLKLKARILNETGDPVPGEIVEFYDHSLNTFIGSNTTDVNGITIFDYYVDSNTAGPNLLYAKLGKVKNYSYFILDAPISINLDIWPQNRNVSKTGSLDRTFSIHGFLQDAQNLQPIKNSGISIHLFEVPTKTEILNGLILESGSYQSDVNGEIDAVFSVASFVDTDNYTLEVWFNGTFFTPPPKPYAFYLSYVSNFSVAAYADYQLKIYDPEEVIIIFKIEGTHRSLFYNDGNPPETYKRGEIADFEVWINQSGLPAPLGSTVRLRDIYTNDILDFHDYDGTEGGNAQFTVDTTTLHAGLHYIEVEYEYNSIVYPYNSTYIIINETVSISGSSTDYIILRNNDIFTISGTLSDLSENLRGLQVEIILLDSAGTDVSVHLDLFDPKIQFINDAGYYSYTSRIFQNCIQGAYDILINFTGRIEHSDGILFISLLTPYMVSSNHSIPINITAGTQLTDLFYYTEYQDDYPYIWVGGDTIYVNGTLNWDNNTGVSGMIINVTVELLDGTVISYNDTVYTDLNGYFDVSIYIDPSNPLWPTERSLALIRITFDPITNNIDNVVGSEGILYPP
ncbi:MAG: transglutaminase-like domain-containing protein [Promethearchaeota archaeon]